METLAVLAIGAVLAAGVGVSATHIMETARRYSAQESISQYKAALQSYYLDCGTFPTTEQGLSALWQKPNLIPIPNGWNGPYVDREIKKDPWQNEYLYFRKGSASFPEDCPSALPYAIISYGADGIKGGNGSDEDIVSWK